MKKVIAYTDGSSLGNPGKGGYGAILRFEDSTGVVHESRLSKGYQLTTNGRMEVMGILAVLEALIESVDVTIYSDSQYVVKAFDEGWLDKWKNNGWRKSDKTPVKNIDLWDKICELKAQHKLKVCWVKGHAGHEENELCDQLARTAASSDNLAIDEGYVNPVMPK